jgi:hypothetical protein
MVGKSSNNNVSNHSRKTHQLKLDVSYVLGGLGTLHQGEVRTKLERKRGGPHACEALGSGKGLKEVAQGLGKGPTFHNMERWVGRGLGERATTWESAPMGPCESLERW